MLLDTRAALKKARADVASLKMRNMNGHFRADASSVEKATWNRALNALETARGQLQCVCLLLLPAHIAP